MVSELEGLSMNETWDLPVIQFLNDLLYIKEKNYYDADVIRRSTTKATQY
jgi:hypothetical protein